ncbi:hypothetical protein ACJX0J_040898, partial [Zea mays]
MTPNALLGLFTNNLYAIIKRQNSNHQYGYAIYGPVNRVLFGRIKLHRNTIGTRAGGGPRTNAVPVN